jgi:hypothetical protein
MATDKSSVELIRSAWLAGKKTIEIDGVQLKLEKQEKMSQIHHKDGTSTKKKMVWIVASPVEKYKFVPLFNIALSNNSKVIS